MKRPLALCLATLAVLAALPGAPASAAFPGDNGRLAVHRFGVLSSLGEIVTMAPDGSAEVDLTATPLIEDRDPAWSPDGRRIAFRRTNAGPDQLWVMKAGGTGLVAVPGSGVAGRPDWSPDGKRLVYECWVPLTIETDICVRDVAGGGFALLTATAGISERRPVWSPDGTRIVFSRELPAGTGSFLVALELKSLSLTALTPQVAGRYDAWPDWSPDGELAFSRFILGTGNGGAIHTVNGTGGRATLVTAPPPGSDTHHTMPAWSPDGKWIAYVDLDDDEGWGHIHTIRPDGTLDTQITFGGATDEVPDWQPV